MYVGYTIDFESREDSHMSTLLRDAHHNKYLQNSINKYGIENFKFEILEECEERLLTALEHYWCTILRTHEREYGYNFLKTNPNRVNIRILDKTKDKISKTLKGRPVSQEMRDRISKTLMGHPGAFKGKTHTEEAKKKISEKTKGRKLTEGQRKAISEAQKGRIHSLETRIKMSNSSNRRSLSEKEKENIRKRVRKPIIQKTLDGEFIKEWISLKSATDAHKGDISAALAGSQKTAGGYTWEYKNKGINTI